jgi:phosphoserine phosphatase
MFNRLVIQGTDVPSGLLKAVHTRVRSTGGIQKLRDTEVGSAFALPCEDAPSGQTLTDVLEECSRAQCDVTYAPAHWSLTRFRLAAFDMDSTLISIECIDEIADFAGVKAEVSGITESAMRGEIDYPESLRRRVALLAGLNESVLESVYQERLMLNPGCERLCTGLKAAGVTLMVVSGGFTFFTTRIAQRLGFSHAHSNVLEVKGGKLTGRVASDIFDGQAKRRELLNAANQMGLSRESLIAVGDGANDLPMMELCELSMAYHAKPKVQERARVAINHVGLDGLLSVLA